MSSKNYWARREAEALKHYITQEEAYTKRLNEIYDDMLRECEKEINAFITKYAAAEGITLHEAKKRISQADIEAYERKAEKYVKEKDFSDEANAEMRLYNAMMKINRLEMLKANIGLELISGHDELNRFMTEILKGRTSDELERQAGILGNTVRSNARLADSIVNASFHNATFSQRIWAHQDQLRQEIGKALVSGLIGGKNARVICRDIEKKFNSSKSAAETLMRTELARVQTDAQKRSFERNGFKQYMFITNSGCCPICQALDEKVFDVEKLLPGENAPPMHPNCRCSIAAYEDNAEYEAWLDYLDRGGPTSEWNKINSVIDNAAKSGIILPRDKFLNYALDFNHAVGRNKAILFKNRLGYDITNCSELIQKIYESIDTSKLVEKGNQGYGDKFELITEITGANGKTEKVVTAWIKEGSHLRLVSPYIKGK